MKIAVDAAGGDYAPHEVIKGAIRAAQEYGVEIALVGRKNVLRKLVEHSKTKPGLGISIVDAKQVIDFNEHPMKAIQSKPNSSIVVGIGLLKSGGADAFVSAGNTGAVVGAALLTLGKTKGVSRPAIGCFLDTVSSFPALLVDAGANADCRPEHLLEFARLGSLFSQAILKIERPRVGLLSNGTEDGKGNRLVHDSYPLLKNATDINFVGSIEGQDIVKRTTDVIVTDGFTGNIVIKTIEGFSDNFLVSVRQIGHVFSSAYRLRGRDLLRDIGLTNWARKLDYTEYGGACLLGVNGNVIIAHGRSQARAIKNAIGLAKETVERCITQKVKEEKHEQTS
ncbi:MAG TPA: phosphate acyltransferase PlsX [Dehalococcoidales bacterium]|nr:MAG: phosphate acyltransferase [Chloroflexi bacterium RBG_16_60_22]HJX13886.1 phosphate acyltransferase PlsX [Dehalococcoidales bacterium]